MKAIIFHGSPYNFDSFNTLSNFNSDCLYSGNTGLLAHYFYYVIKEANELIIENFVIPEVLRHACKSGSIRGAVDSEGYVYIAVIGLNKFLIADKKESLEFFESNFPELKIVTIYDKLKNNKEIFRYISNQLVKKYDADTVAEMLSATGYRGLRELMMIGFSTLYIWDNTFVTENKIVKKLHAHKIGPGSPIKNYVITEI